MSTCVQSSASSCFLDDPVLVLVIVPTRDVARDVDGIE